METPDDKSRYGGNFTEAPGDRLGVPGKATMSEVTLNEPLESEVAVSKGASSSSEDKSEPPAEAPVPVSLGRLFHYADTKDRWLLVVGLVTALLTSAVLPITVVLFGEVTDAMATFGLNSSNSDNRDYFVSSMDWFVYGILVVSVYQVLTSLMYVFCLYYSATRQAKRIKLLFLRSALRQEIAWYDKKVMGDFTTRVTEDLRKIEEGIGEKLGMILVNISMFFIGLVMAFCHGWELTLVVLSFMPLVLIAGGFMGKMQATFAAKEAEAYSVAGAVAEEVIGAVRTVMAFGGEQKEADRYAVGLKGATRAMIWRSAVTAIGVGSVWLVQFASFTLAFWYGTKLVVESRVSGDGEYEPGDLVIVFFSILIGAMSVGQTAPQAEAVSSARGAAASVFATIEKKSEIDSSSTEGERPDTVQGFIEFKDVHFNYPSRPDSQVLRGTSFSVRPGQTVALVGSSGCGKSTCIQLLQRFYDPLSGQVLLDGRPLHQLNVSWLRKQIGVVSQEPVLFGTSIAENIRYGSPGCSMKEVERAAREANAYDFIQELPLKFDTLVGQKGAQLSGGQKQRIAIARALVRNPRLFLLDEATSALDLKSEALVQEALDKARSGRTTIVVAHRLSTVRTADLICALKDGRVAEVGSHQQLMQSRGVYHSLVTSQTGETQLQEEEESVEEELGSRHESTGRDSVVSRTRLVTVSSTHGSEMGAVEEDHVEIVSNGTRASFSGKVNARAKNASLEDEDYEASLPAVSGWRILSMNRREWPYLLLGAIGSSVMGALLPAYAVVFGVILGNLSEADPDVALENAKLYGLLFLAVGAVAFVATFLQMFMFGVAGERLTTRMRKLAFSALLRQEISYFDDVRHSVGVLCARLSGDASALQGATGSRVANVTQAVFTVLLGLALAFYLSWQLALASAPFVPLCALATYLESKTNSGSAVSERSELETGNQIAVEAIANIRTVAGLGLEEMFADQYQKRLETSHLKDARKAALRGLVYGVAVTVPTVAYAAVFGVGKPLVLNGTIPYQNLFMVTESLIYGTMVVGAAVAFSPDFKKAFDAAKRLFALLDRVPTIDASLSSGLRPSELRGDITLEQVQFRYPTRPDAQVLRSLSLRVQPGQTVALVGASGCGKSTCIQLLQRLYNPDSGHVTLDNHEVSTLNLRWLRSHIGIVSQEPTLFDKTIRENIAYGDCTREVPMDEIIAAARDANIHQFVTSLPAGYETQLGSSSSTQLSGGQKQRIAIARALVRRPAVLLLDEATSALDAESEKVVQEALDRAASGRTCIVIAHRLSTIQGADLIAVVHKGRVVEQGTHQQLLAKKHMYYELYKTMA